MLVNMAVWHTTDRGDIHYPCLHVGDVGLLLLVICWMSVCWSSSPFLKSNTRSECLCVAGEKVSVHWQFPAVELDRRSHDCFLLIFVYAGSCRISCEGALPGPQKPEEFFKSLSWRHSRAQRYQGPGLLSRNSTLRFSLPFSLTLRHLALLL